MMKRFIDYFVAHVIVPYLEPRMRTGSIKAAKAYLQAVGVARKLVIYGFVIGSLSAILITGGLMMLFGILALLPLQPQVAPIIAIVLGALFAGVTGTGFFIFFREKNWLKVTKSYEIMEAVTAPWENEVVPPNPLAVLRGEGPKGALFEEKPESRDISTAVIAADKTHIPHTDVAAVNVGGSAAIMSPEAPVIIPPAVESSVTRREFETRGRELHPAF